MSKLLRKTILYRNKVYIYSVLPSGKIDTHIQRQHNPYGEPFVRINSVLYNAIMAKIILVEKPYKPSEPKQ